MTDRNHWASFDFEGRVTVAVQPIEAAATSAEVRPRSAAIPNEIVAGEVRFELTAHARVFVAIEGLEDDPLFVFANPVETEPPPDPDAEGVLYFGPGLHTRTNEESAAELADGTEVYLAGGAFVEGLLAFENNAAFTVRGRGVLSGVQYPHTGRFENQLIAGAGNAEVRIEGVTLTDGPHYALISRGTTTVENVKFMGWHHNSDGVVVGPNSVVRDVFFKLNDDGVKLYHPGVRVSNVVYWLQPTGSAFQLGWNTPQEVQNVRVQGVDVIGCDRTGGTIDQPINNAIIASRNLSAASNLHDYEFRDFRVECAPFQIMDIQTFDARSPSAGGIIRDLTLVDWTVDARPRLPIVLREEPTESTVGAMIFDNVRVGGERIDATTYDDGTDFLLTEGDVDPPTFR
jgi:hypothetical protein